MNILSRIVLTAALAAAPATALAHPGDHSGLTLAQAAQHMLTQPDHMAVLAMTVALAGAGWGALKVWRAR
jgi:ABC-type enterochelin transport system permease subunit